MTIRSDLEAQIAAIEARAAAEKAPLEAELKAAGSWLDQEWHEFEAWTAGLLKHKAPDVAAPNPPPAPPAGA